MARSDGSSRAAPRLLLAIAACALLARVGFGWRERRHPPTLPDLVHWHTPAEAERLLDAEPRATLYEFSAGWCEPCLQLQQEVLGDERGAAAIEAFVAVKVPEDPEDRDPRVRELRQRFQVDVLPTLVVAGPHLKAPLFLRGYPGRAKTLAFLSKAREQ